MTKNRIRFIPMNMISSRDTRLIINSFGIIKSYFPNRAKSVGNASCGKRKNLTEKSREGYMNVLEVANIRYISRAISGIQCLRVWPFVTLFRTAFLRVRFSGDFRDNRGREETPTHRTNKGFELRIRDDDLKKREKRGKGGEVNFPEATTSLERYQAKLAS